MIQGVVDNPIELLIYVLIFLAVIMVLFRFQNWMDSRPVKEKKKEEKKETKTEVVKETVKEEKKDINIKIDKDEIVKEVKDQVYSEVSADIRKGINNNLQNGGYSNYLYDRFVNSPTIEDSVDEKKTFQSFLTDEEVSNIRDRDIKINVKNTEDISKSSIKKDKLYDKIEQMVYENLETKEKMLEEFEKLPKSMKLLIIENIMQKM
ncbi:MAG: hypothetical protein ACI4PF_06535 [Christensenellales bacterium]